MSNLSTNLKLIKMNIKAQKKGFDVAKTIALSGKPGIGKTVRMRQLAKDMDMEFYHQSMPEMDISVMSGLPEFHKVEGISVAEFHKNGIEGQGVVWTMPEIIMNANILASKNKNGVILMLDDLHQTPISTMPYLYQLLNEKSLGNYKLAENVFLVAGLNDSADANFDGIESPVMNRMSFLKTEFDSVEFLEGYAKRFPFQIRSFLEQNPDFINEDESTVSAFATPRSWSSLSQTFEFMETEDKDFLIDNVFALASGSVSEKASMELEKHVSYIEKLNLQKYIEEGKVFDTSKLPSLDQVLLGYLPNFVKTTNDGMFLCELLNENKDNSNFIGFTVAEIYTKYNNRLEAGDEKLKGLTNGVKFVIGNIIEDDDLVKSSVSSLDDKAKKKAIAYKMNDDLKSELFEVLSNFLE